MTKKRTDGGHEIPEEDLREMEQEEGREMPDGVESQTGYCRFCGQAGMVHTLTGWSQEDVDEAVTCKCECDAAKKYAESKERVQKAKSRITELFGSTAERPIDQDVVMLVLTERKTRDEIIVKLPDQKAASVVEAIDRLERKWGDMFTKVFRSITVDNGVEFSDYEGLERSVLHEGEKRTFAFYCHPYSSWERGSNENNNRLIRRHIPKGEDFDEKQDRDIEYIENWINNYPRGIFGFKTSAQLFEEEIRKLA